MSGSAKSLLFGLHRFVATRHVWRSNDVLVAQSRSVAGFCSVSNSRVRSAGICAGISAGICAGISAGISAPLLSAQQRDTSLRALCSTKAGTPYKDDDYPPLPDYGSDPEPQTNEVYIIRAKGLPWSCTAQDLLHFFSDCRVRGGVKGVHLTVNQAGRPSGQAFIEMEHEEDVSKALEKHRQYLGPRYVEVHEVTDFDAEAMLKKSVQLPAKDGVVRLRGVPFSCTEADILTFFSGLDVVDNGVTIVTNHRGKATGAYVQFVSNKMAEEALQRDREVIGNRYIEVFLSQRSEIPSSQRRTESASRPPPLPRSDSPTHPRSGLHHTAVPSLHYVHMRGLPFQATGEDVVEFFSPLALSKILIEYGPDGRASGEADVFFAHHEDAVSAMSKDKAYMQERYIELFLNTGQ